MLLYCGIQITEPGEEGKTYIIKRLWEKNIFYLKADKGIKVVILDKRNYYERINNIINDGTDFKITRKRLPKIISKVRKIHSNDKEVVTADAKRKLHISKPSVSKLYF